MVQITNQSSTKLETRCIVYTQPSQNFEGNISPTSGLKTIKYPSATGIIIEHNNELETGSNGNVKVGKQRLRFNLIFNLVLWILVPLPFWLKFVVPFKELALWILFGIQGSFLLFWLVVLVLAFFSSAILFWNRNRDFAQMMNKDEKSKKIQHLVVLSCYKEPLEVLTKTIDSLASQTMALNSTLVISFEERTPNLTEKQFELFKRYSASFADFFFAVHPFALPNEIPGKCSNCNCGIRTALGHIRRREGVTGFNPDNIIITTCDADSKFHPKFLEALTYKFINEKDPNSCVFQAPLLYNWNLDALSFVTRVTGLIRAFLMQGALIPLNINTMSIFSFSASLCIAGGYIHPAYQMDDIIALIRWMGVAKKKLKIVQIPVPLISGPTSGRTFEDEVEEWARQARRWTIGASEVFHYFVIKSRNIPFFTALSWGIVFFIYYGIILCCSSLYNITFSIAFAVLMNDSDPLYFYLTYASLGIQYFIFAGIFILDRINVRLTVPVVHERISIIRNLFQWLLSPLVMVGYSLVEFYALHEVMIKGREVCKHGASKKDELKV